MYFTAQSTLGSGESSNGDFFFHKPLYQHCIFNANHHDMVSSPGEHAYISLQFQHTHVHIFYSNVPPLLDRRVISDVGENLYFIV